MRAHYLQHVGFEGLGSIQPWLVEAGYSVTGTHFYRGETLPLASEVDFLVVMGGPMSVKDEDEHPWLVAEKIFIRDVIAAGKPVLGICLGAQLIANAMGEQVFANTQKEIGWFPIQSVETDARHAFRFPSVSEVFHWHGETFSLPERAVHLASSAACVNQAFQLGPNVIGLQFHLETTPESARAMVEHCADELVSGDFIQSAEAILGVDAARYQSINTLMASVLAYLHRHQSP